MSPPPRPDIWPAVASYVAAVFLVFAATTALVFGVAFSRAAGLTQVTDEATHFALSAPGIMACALVSAAMLGIVALAAARLQTRDIRTVLRLAPTRVTLPGIVAAVSGMVGLSLVSGATCELLGLRGQGNMAAIAQALARPSPGRLVMAIGTIAIAPALAEEAFFRGLIQTRLAARWERWPSIVVTSVGFGLVHLDLVQGCVAFVAGLFLGWLVDRFGGIRPAIAAHAFNNVGFVALASMGSDSEVTRAKTLWIVGVGSVVLIVSLAVLRSRLAGRRT